MLTFAEASEKKQRRKGGTRRRYSKHAAELADQKRNNAAVQVGTPLFEISWHRSPPYTCT